MTLVELLQRMDEAFKEDRERFFKVADTLAVQPKYKERLEELEALKQEWRDIPQEEGYPNITHPRALPEWLPKIPFASSWGKDKYIEEMLNSREAQIDSEESSEDSNV